MKIIIGQCSKNDSSVIVQALKLLGYPKAYGYQECTAELCQQWKKILQNGASKKQLFEMYENVDIIYDSPASYYWEDLLNAFPDSKIIFVKQDKYEWVNQWKSKEKLENESWISRKMNNILSPTANNVTELNRLIHQNIFKGKENGDYRNLTNDVLIKSYEKYCDLILERCPKEKLLEYTIMHGWAPLCKFLNCNEPEVDFPVIKSLSTATTSIDLKIHQEAYMSYLAITIIIALSMTLVNLYLLMFP